ncbi:MAG: DUF4416 family protein [Candidatus Eisenbacteria bacterium]
MRNETDRGPHAGPWIPADPVTDRVLPLVGVLARPPHPATIETRLEALFGPILLRSPAWEFTATRYYEREMGTGLMRSFFAFPPTRFLSLPAWKLATGRLEHDWSGPDGRRVNLDPGYVSLGGLFLASTTPAAQRIPLSHGIHAEITLFYARGEWQVLPWTFPDFRCATYHPFLTECREALKRALRAGEPQSA